jgi:sporulation protein YlmC with PRC-barrel domain
MKPDGRIKLVSQLLDLPLLDSGGSYCGIVDDIELSGAPGKELKLKALLVGPGAFSGRMPGWLFWLVRKIAGDRIVRVPLGKIESIGSAVRLTTTAKQAGLHQTENKVRKWIPRGGAL